MLALHAQQTALRVVHQQFVVVGQGQVFGEEVCRQAPLPLLQRQIQCAAYVVDVVSDDMALAIDGQRRALGVQFVLE